MFQFVMKASGGKDGHLLKETESLCRTHAPATRKVGGDTYKELSHDMKHAGGEQALSIRHGLLSRAYIYGDVTPSDTKKLFTKDVQAKAVHADAILCKLRALVNAMPADETKQAAKSAFGFASMWASSLAIGLKLPDQGKHACKVAFKSVEAIAHNFIELLNVSVPAHAQIKSEWEDHAHKDVSKAKAESKCSEQVTLTLSCVLNLMFANTNTHIFVCLYVCVYTYRCSHICSRINIAMICNACVRMREATEDGTCADAANMLKERGFHVGQWVKRAADDTTANIVGFVQSNVIMLVNGRKSTVPMQGFLNNEWKQTAEVLKPVVLSDLVSAAPTKYIDFKLNMVSGTIQRELYFLSEKYMDKLGMIEVQLVPERQVRCKQDIEVGELVLVPSTLKVNRTKGDVDGQLKVVTSIKDWNFVLGPFSCPKDAGYISPFFMVQSSVDKKTANMAITMVVTDIDASIQIPVLKNTKKLTSGTVLVTHTPKTTKAQQVDPVRQMRMNGKTIHEEEVEEQPSKRSRGGNA
jgi:hypothetical protein